MKTTKVRCTFCGRIIEATTVTMKHYEEGQVIDYGCPYDGAGAPLVAVSAKKKKKKEKVTIEPEPTEELL